MEGFVSIEGQAIGTDLGSISEVSADYNASHTYSLSEANSTNHNHLFSMDENGKLSNLAVFDYETNATEYKISVRASSNGALVSEKTYLVFISDADEDLDGDGFSNAEETAYGSDPNDKDSIPNSAPTNITGSLSVSKKMPNPVLWLELYQPWIRTIMKVSLFNSIPHRRYR